IPGQGTHNVVFVATEKDSVYAFDADGLNASALWHDTFVGSARSAVPCDLKAICDVLTQTAGITGTPVIDISSKTLYVVVLTLESSGLYLDRLHALDLTTGAEKFGGP